MAINDGSIENELIDIDDGEEQMPTIEQLMALRDEVGEEGLTDEEFAVLADYEKTESPGEGKHYDNLALSMEEGDLSSIANRVLRWVEWDEESRTEWQVLEKKGIRLLGVTPNTDGGAEFKGASKVVHPMLAEACVQFAARALSVIWPAGGPVKTSIMGVEDEEVTEQAGRVEKFMNYQYTQLMPGAFEQTDKMLFRLPLSGSVFMKGFYDKIDGVVRKMVEPADFIVPYRSTDLRSSQRYTERVMMYQNDVRKRQVAGLYRDVKLSLPTEDTGEQERDIVVDEIRSTEGRNDQGRILEDHRHTLYDCYCELNLKGFEDKDEKGNETGIALPYLVTVELNGQKVLGIYRQWKPNDPERRKIINHIHYWYTPGLGFYGYGLYHLIGGLSKAATGALRALMDSAQFSNLQGGYRSKDAGLNNGDQQIGPGEWKDVDCDATELSKAFFPLPYKEPSNVLFALMGALSELGQRFAGTTDAMVGEGNQNTPVGTMLARIEQGGQIISAVQKRIHHSQGQEFKLISWLDSIYMPEEYPYRVPGEDLTVLRKDFDDRVDVLPVSDPNFVSNTQRYYINQAVLELANSQPGMYDMREVHKRGLEALRVDDIDTLMPEQGEAPHIGPVQEIAVALQGMPIKAYPDQDHQSHITVHQGFLETADKQQVEMVGPALTAHIQEHYAQAFIIQMQQATQVELPMPTGEEDEENQIPPEVENQVAMLAAQAMQEMQAQMEQAPDPEMVASQADIERKDNESQRSIERKDAESQAGINRNQSKLLADLDEQSKRNKMQIDELFKRSGTPSE